MASRRAGVALTALGMQVVGLGAVALAIAALGRWPQLAWTQVPWALALAFVGTLSLAALYRAFALGPIAVVSPVVASYAALSVVGIVVVLGERLTGGQAIAIAVTFVGVVVASTDVRQLRQTLGRPVVPEGVRIGVLATVGFGNWGVILTAATRASDPFALVGVLDTGANVLLMLGVEAGFASFVMTGSGAYPIIPAVLAILMLRERLAPNQYLGVAILITGLLSLGLQG